jgi:hypothetical protein
MVPSPGLPFECRSRHECGDNLLFVRVASTQFTMQPVKKVRLESGDSNPSLTGSIQPVAGMSPAEERTRPGETVPERRRHQVCHVGENHFTVPPDTVLRPCEPHGQGCADGALSTGEIYDERAGNVGRSDQSFGRQIGQIMAWFVFAWWREPDDGNLTQLRKALVQPIPIQAEALQRRGALGGQENTRVRAVVVEPTATSRCFQIERFDRDAGSQNLIPRSAVPGEWIAFRRFNFDDFRPHRPEPSQRDWPWHIESRGHDEQSLKRGLVRRSMRGGGQGPILNPA